MKHSDSTPIPSRRVEGLSILLWLWTIGGCVLPNIWLSIADGLSIAQGMANVLLPCGLYVLLMSLTRNVGKASLWMVILFVFAAFQSVLLYMYGRQPIAVDMFLNVVTTNMGEINELLGNLLVIMGVIFAIYLPPIIAAIVAVCRKWRLTEKFVREGRRASYVLMILGAVSLVAGFFSERPYNLINDLYPLNIAYNMEVAVHRTVRVNQYDETSAGFRFDAVSERPDSLRETYVVVIGETSRADNWQLLGYDRPTTPQLVGLKNLTGFGRALSQSNTTHKSVPMLMSHLDARSFGDSIYYSKSMLSAFREAGYRTYFFSNQARNHSFIDFFGEEADSAVFIRDFKPEGQPVSYDTDLLRYLDEALKNPAPKKLIVLHTYGSHFNYFDRYPQTAAPFQPDKPVVAAPSHRETLVNAYDNTVHFTAEMLRQTIDRLQADSLTAAALLYTSDHGEDIFDDARGLFLHASPIPSYYQIHVPLVAWVNDSYARLNPEALPALEENSGKLVATSRSLFHSLMDAAAVRSPYVDASASVFNSGYWEPALLYLNDHNDGISLWDCGLLAPDLEMLSRLGIRQ